MDASSEFVFIQLPLLLVVGAAVASLAWWQHQGALSRRVGGRLPSSLKVFCVVTLAAAWLLLTVATWWCLFLWAYLTVLGAYVLFGVAGGWVALVGYGVLTASVPFAWGTILFGLARREFRYAAAGPNARALRELKLI